MRRSLGLVLGGLELAAAGVIGVLAARLPSAAEVGRGFDHAEKVTRAGGRQVAAVRAQLGDLRRPEVRQLARDLQTQAHTAADLTRGQQIDFAAVQALHDGLTGTAAGLDHLADTVDPERLARLGTGLDSAAKFLDDVSVPAEQAAGQLERTTAELQQDAQRLAVVLRAAPPDLQAVRDVHESLSKIAAGLTQTEQIVQFRQLDTVRTGLGGLGNALDTTAGQVDRVSRYGYPVVRRDGWKLGTDVKPFWPDGPEVAEGLRQGAAGMRAAGQELGGLAERLPALQQSVAESRVIVEKTRDALGAALRQHDQIALLLKNAPEHAARLAEELPQVGASLARLLRGTRELRQVAEALRQTRQGLSAVGEAWPDHQRALRSQARLLRAAAQQLDHVLAQRAAYESAVHQSSDLAERLANSAPVLAEQTLARLEEQDRSLADLEANLGGASDCVPVYAQAAGDLLTTGRLLAWLLAATVGLHGSALLVWRTPAVPQPGG